MNDWIEVGSALVSRKTIVAVGELDYSKHEEMWEFNVFIYPASDSRCEYVRVGSKSKDFAEEYHNTLKQELTVGQTNE